jgi:Icc-related predicted phosphoesterase
MGCEESRVKLRRSRADGSPVTATADVYYASDVHGSDVCWRKFLGAARFYGASSLIMGGDLTGKAIVPIEVDSHGRFTTTFLGETRSGTTASQLTELREAIRFNGMYPWATSREDIQLHREDGAAREELFERVMLDELRRWIALADERLEDIGAELFIMAGNDDPWSVDDVLRSGERVIFCDDQLVRVACHEMVSLSYANPTPWHSPRELDESELYKRLRALADQLEEPQTAIFNLHVPPYDSELDRALEIAPDLTRVYKGGQPVEIPVGSHAVRQIIEEVQPLLSLHGHIHESRGSTRIGHTLAINSGSEYGTGRLHGVSVRLADDSVVSHQFLVG